MRINEFLFIKSSLIFSTSLLYSIFQANIALAKPALSPISVRYFLGYKEITYRDARILVERVPSYKSGRTISFIKNGRQLFVTSDLQKSIYELSIRNFNQQIYVAVKIQQNGPAKVGVIPYKDSIHLDGVASVCERSTLQSSIDKLTSKELLSKLSENASYGFMDDTCDEMNSIDKKYFTSRILKQLSPNTSFLVGCLNNKEVQEELQKNSNLKDVSTQALALYLSNIEDIASGKGKLKIGCFQSAPIGTEGKSKISAVYDTKTPAIRFPLSTTGELVSNACKNQEQLFSHEMIHATGAPDPIPYQLDTLCATKMGIKSATDAKCKEEYPSFGNKGAEVAQAIKNVNQNIDKKAHQQMQVVLQEKINPEEIVAVAQSDVDTIASSDANSNSNYQSVVERVYNSASTNMERMAMPLNLAASTISEAGASSSLNSNSTVSPKRRYTETAPSNSDANMNEISKIKKSTKVVEYKVEEMVLDKYGSEQSNVTTLTQNKADRLPANILPAKELVGPQNTSSEVVKDGIASGANSGKSADSSTIPTNSMMKSGLPRRNSDQTGVSNNGAIYLGQNLVTELSVSTYVTGQAYQQFKAKMKDKTFNSELKAQGISIYTNGKNFIGADPRIGKYKFRDDGVSLQRVGGGK